MDIKSIKINDDNYLLEKDVDKFYTRKDKVEVDRLVLESSLEKLSEREFVNLISEIALKKIKNYGYAEINDVMDPEHDDRVLKPLMIMAFSND